MGQTFLGAVLLFSAGATTREEKKPAPPKGPAPQKAVAFVDDKGFLFLLQTVTRNVVQYRTIVRVQNGQKVQETVAVRVPVQTQVQRRWPIKDIQVFDHLGQAIDQKTWSRLLKKRTPVLVSADGRQVDPAHLIKVPRGTMVLVLPTSKKAPAKPQTKKE
jgi:hypothetical protein